MFETPDDSKDPRRDSSYRSDPRLYALGHWKKRIFSATADQFFPFMQYGYGPICLLPFLVESVLVVDEVHSFDKSMFSTLKRFLKEFPDVPVLCMTATLPVERRNDLDRMRAEAISGDSPGRPRRRIRITRDITSSGSTESKRRSWSATNWTSASESSGSPTA